MAVRGKVLNLKSSPPNVGAEVVTIGAPQGLEFCLNRGVMSSTRTSLKEQRKGRLSEEITWQSCGVLLVNVSMGAFGYGLADSAAGSQATHLPATSPGNEQTVGCNFKRHDLVNWKLASLSLP